MRKFIIGVFILLAVSLVAAIAFPFLFKDKIISAAKETANQELNATLNFSDLDVSLLQNIRNFPDITLVVHKPSIVGKNQFLGDTLVAMDKLLLALDIQSVFQTGNPMKINAIDIVNAKINALVDTGGNANWDIAKKTEQKKEPSKFSLHIDEIRFENVDIHYWDKKANQSADILALNHEGKGNFSDNIVQYASSTEIGSLSYYKGLIPYLKSVKLSNESEVEIDQIAKKYSFSKNKIQLNALELVLNGFVQIMDKDDALGIKLDFATENNEFKQILSLVPAIYQNNFKSIKTNGNFDLKGNIEGVYHANAYPKMDILFNVMNGEFQYPDLPKKVSNITINSSIKSEGGSLDNIMIDVSKFSMLLGADPFEGRLKLSNPITNANVELYTRGKINLADVMKFYPMEEVKKLEGVMQLDLNLKAKKSDIQARNYQAISAQGTANVKGLVYESKTVDKPVRVSDVTLNFSPQYVDMTSCVGAIGATDFDVKGKLENFIGYYLSKDEVMKGNIAFYSHKIDMNEFTSDKSSKKSEYVMVPQKIEFIGTAKVDEMLYGKMNIKNISGSMTVKDEKINLNNVYAELLGGSAKMDAIYSTVGQSKPMTAVKYDALTFDMNQVFNYMESAQKLAPILQYMTGKLSSTSHLTMMLTPDMSPDLTTLNGDLTASIPFAKIANVPALQQIAQVTKLNQLSNLEANNIQAKMTFVDGKVVVQPMNFKANNMNIGLQGMQGLDKSIDYKMSVDVPFSQLGNASSVVNGLISKFNLPFVGNINPETVRLNLNLKGFFDKPQVALGAPELISNGKSATATQVATDAIKNTANDLKNQAVKKADSMKQVLQNEAQKAADDLKKKAEEEVNKKKDDLLNELKKKLPW